MSRRNRNKNVNETVENEEVVETVDEIIDEFVDDLEEEESKPEVKRNFVQRGIDNAVAFGTKHELGKKAKKAVKVVGLVTLGAGIGAGALCGMAYRNDKKNSNTGIDESESSDSDETLYLEDMESNESFAGVIENEEVESEVNEEV